MEHLEKVKQLTDFETIKSFNYPYVAVDENKQLRYSPITDYEILNEFSQTDRRIEEPCVLNFLSPSYFIRTDSFDVITDFQSMEISFTQDVYDKTNPPRLIIDGNSGFDDLHNGTYTSTINASISNTYKLENKLIKFSIQIYQPGLLHFGFPALMYNMFQNSTIPTLNSSYTISENTTQFLLCKNPLLNNKSCYIKWESDQDAQLFCSYNSDFTPTTNSIYVTNVYDLPANTPIQFYDILNNLNRFYLNTKLVSSSPGILHFMPQKTPVQHGATLINNNEEIYLQSGYSKVFAFPKTVDPTEFITNIPCLINIQFVSFEQLEDGSENIIIERVHKFSQNNNLSKLQLSSNDIQTLSASSTDDYAYFRFECDTDVTLTPTLWNTSSCINNTILVTSGETFTVPANSKSVYRMVYDDWKNYDFTMKWTGKTSLSSKFASYCNFTTTATNLLSSVAIKSGKSAKVASTVVDNWMSRLEDDGFVYFRLTSSRVGDMTMTSAKDEQVV